MPAGEERAKARAHMKARSRMGIGVNTSTKTSTMSTASARWRPVRAVMSLSNGVRKRLTTNIRTTQSSQPVQKKAIPAKASSTTQSTRSAHLAPSKA